MMLKKGTPEYRKVALAMNFEMEVVFKRNLEFFKGREPDLHQHFLSYKPQRLTLGLDESGYLNLFNIDTANPVYPENPADYAAKQADEFLRNRYPLSMDLNIDDVDDNEYIYIECLNKLSDCFDRHSEGWTLSASKHNMPHLFMIGGGLFLQLEHILNRVDVKSLCVFEPDSDTFYCSMHLIDWSEIYKYFDRDGYNFRLFLLGDEVDNASKIAGYLNEIGLYRFPLFEFYKHYNNPVVDAVQTTIKGHIQSGVGCVGFFEDERTGFAHTIDSLKRAFPFSKKNNPKPDINYPPAIVVANGPSLDQSKEFLLAASDSSIVISAGTALRSLLKMGVVPDIHVEQERILLVKDLIEQSGDPDLIRKIPLIALNTVHPNVLDLFDVVNIGIKASDMGMSLIKELKVGGEVIPLINPLVANCAFTMASYLGFDEIYLVGVDCGMADLKKHHSQHSLVSGEHAEFTELFEASGDYNGAYKVVGNFGKDIYTTPVYNLSRLVIEAVIKNQGVQVYNVGDGAKIAGAIEFDPDTRVSLPAIENKEVMITDLLQSHFQVLDPDFEQLHEKVERVSTNALMVLRNLHQLISFNSLEHDEMNSRFSEIHGQLLALAAYDSLAFNLLNGSISGICYKINVYRYRLSDEEFESYYKEAKTLIDQFFTSMIDHVENKMLDFGTF